MLSELLAVADIHLLPQKADAADLVMPSKLSGMLASGRCVIVTADDHTELAQVVRDRARCGLVVAPERPDDLVAAILTLANAGRTTRDALGASGRRYAEAEIDRNSILRRFEDEVRSLAQ